MDEAAVPVEADVVKKRVWIGNGTATFIISLLTVLGTFTYIAVVTFFPTSTTMGKEQEGIIIGTFLSAFMTTLTYWVGTSLTSANKSIELADKK